MIDPRSTRAYKLEKENRELKKEKERLNNIIKDIREMAEEKSREEIFGWLWEILRIIKGSDKEWKIQ